jgi:hypothetical protein
LIVATKCRRYVDRFFFGKLARLVVFYQLLMRGQQLITDLFSQDGHDLDRNVVV